MKHYNVLWYFLLFLNGKKKRKQGRVNCYSGPWRPLQATVRTNTVYTRLFPLCPESHWTHTQNGDGVDPQAAVCKSCHHLSRWRMDCCFSVTVMTFLWSYRGICMFTVMRYAVLVMLGHALGKDAQSSISTLPLFHRFYMEVMIDLNSLGFFVVVFLSTDLFVFCHF